jgi:hypothetical protein
MLSISFIRECNTASLIDLLYINRSSLSHTNMEKDDALIVLCRVTLFSRLSE